MAIMNEKTSYHLDEKRAKTLQREELFKELKSSISGLSATEAKRRFEEWGPNAIEEKKKTLFTLFFRYFWGPIPWMIESAALLSCVVGNWDDFIIIFILLLVNGLIDFWQEYQAGNAIEALKHNLAPRCKVKREGEWKEIDAKELVVGDLIRVAIGNIIPADAKVIEGDYLTVDQSTLTGESLPVVKKLNDLIYSGSVAKQGVVNALVIATGANTFFGKTTKLVEEAKPLSHFQKAVLQIGDYLIYLSLMLSFLLVIVQLLRATPLIELTQFVLILIVASIPVAMPAVLSVTMALGALKLSKMNAVVTKLDSIEEIAGIDILCCDKTGTLTKNQLSLGETIPYGSCKPEEVILTAMLASEEASQDAIDLAIARGIKNEQELKMYQQEKFIPFDPVRKRTEALLNNGKGKNFYATKGASQVIISLCSLDHPSEKKLFAEVNRLAKRGNRTIAVARSSDGKKTWEFLGLLSLYDPLRDDSLETVKEAKNHGIAIKILTGDNVAIAKEVAQKLSIGNDISTVEGLMQEKSNGSNETAKKIEQCTGFAQVFPEHKYQIVKALQERGHIVGMTGDGVNDAPALKQADVGIAVSPATDAARAAASLVLLAPGVSVITKAIEEARCIFERMNSYSIYRITETIRIMLFMVSSIIVFNFYPVTAIMIILLALLNDIPILAIAYDNTSISKKPVKWEMKKVLTISTVLGFIGILETFLLLYIAKDLLLLSLPEIQSFIFLKLSVAGHQTLFIARTKKSFFSPPYPSAILLASILSTQLLAALLVGFGIFVPQISWTYIALIWGYTIVWMFIEDWTKIHLYKHLQYIGKHHQRFLNRLQKNLIGKASKNI